MPGRPTELTPERMRDEIAKLYAALLAASERSREVHVDALGDAIGGMGISAAEIDALVAALEARGRRVTAPQGGGGEARLATVLGAARLLRAELGRAPTPGEIAARCGLPLREVRGALALGRVMGR